MDCVDQELVEVRWQQIIDNHVREGLVRDRNGSEPILQVLRDPLEVDVREGFRIGGIVLSKEGFETGQLPSICLCLPL